MIAVWELRHNVIRNGYVHTICVSTDVELGKITYMPMMLI